MAVTLLGVWLVGFGILGIGIGIYNLVARGAEVRIQRNFMFRTGLIPIRFLWAAIPEGVAMLFVGLATMFPGPPVSDWLMTVAATAVLIVIVVVIWSPDWLRPKWARNQQVRR